MDVVGYTDRPSVKVGETVKFMVSSRRGTYRADIVRLIHGDPNPTGPGLREEVSESSVNGEYAGREQVITKGSYVVVPDNPLIRNPKSVCIQAWIWPTTPDKGLQGIVTKWSGAESRGYGLFINEEGCLSFRLGDGEGSIVEVSSEVPLHRWVWYFVAASFDADSKTVVLSQEPVPPWPDQGLHNVTRWISVASGPGPTNAPLIMAAYSNGTVDGKLQIAGYYNGKIDSPRLFDSGLYAADISSLRRGAQPSSFGGSLIGDWDFSKDIGSTRATDRSVHALHGRTVNRPAKGMTGHNWTGRDNAFPIRPEEYGAIHFHDDDLDDAGWDVDFEFTVPEGMKSGVYAARLQAGDAVDHVPFFVRPETGDPTAPAAFLVPTFSYMAYGNGQHTEDTAGNFSDYFVPGFEYPVKLEDHYIVDNGLISLYNSHTDGSGVCHSSWLRPIVNMRPGYYSVGLASGKGSPHQLSADLHLVDWLESEGHPYDVITDHDLHKDGLALLKSYKVIVTGSHPEYWSAAMLDAMETYLRDGGRLMYLGGNGFYWVTALDPESGHTIEIRRWGGTQTWRADAGETRISFTGEPGGIWRDRGRAPQRMLGIGFTSQGNDVNAPYSREPGSRDPRTAFIFEGVGDDELIGDFPSLVMDYGAAGFELDRMEPRFGTPPHTIHLATATGFSDSYQHVVEEVDQSTSKQGGTTNPMVKADMVYLRYPRDGAVFSVGSISWCGSLSYNEYDNTVSRVTGNVLRRFSLGEAVP